MLLGFTRLASGRRLYDDEQPPLDPNINDLWISPQNQFWFWDGQRWLSAVAQSHSNTDISTWCQTAWWQEEKSVTFPLFPITSWGYKIFLGAIALNLRLLDNHDDANFYKLELEIDAKHIVTIELHESPKSIRLDYDTSDFDSTDFISAQMSVTGDPGTISGILSLEYQLIYS